jgi:FtsK/SpoIIIE family
VNAWGPYRPPTWRQPVGWSTLHETPPIITAPVIRESPGDWLFNGILRPAWAYRLELALFGVVSVAYVWLGEHLGREGAERLIVAAAFLVATITWTREPLAHALFRSHLRRRWALACRHAELATRNDRIPRITRCRLTRAGEQLRVRVPAGSQVPDLEAKAERIAAFLAVREVRVVRDPASARHARVVVLRRDPLADPIPTPWPLVGVDRLSLWQPIPVGVDEDGNEVTVSLPERNLLEGGEPGSGKSNVLQLLVAVGALDPDVRLTLFDPKLVELAVWQGSAARLVGPNVEEAIEVLKGLIAELDDRYLTLLANRARKVTRATGCPCIWSGSRSSPISPTAPTAKPPRPSLRCCGTSWPGAGPPAWSPSRPPRSPRLMWSRPSSGTCSASGGRSAAPPPRHLTPSLGRAGPVRATRRPRLIRLPEGWGCSCRRAGCRCGCAPAISMTWTWPSWPAAPRPCATRPERRRRRRCGWSRTSRHDEPGPRRRAAPRHPPGGRGAGWGRL